MAEKHSDEKAQRQSLQFKTLVVMLHNKPRLERREQPTHCNSL